MEKPESSKQTNPVKAIRAYCGGVHDSQKPSKRKKVIRISAESGRISVSEAAKLLGVSPQFVRIGLQRGVLPIGAAVKMSSKWTYYISADRLKEYIGYGDQKQLTV